MATTNQVKLQNVSSNSLIKTNQHDSKDCHTDCASNGHTEQPIFVAIKSGLLVPVQTLYEEFGEQVFSSRDESGHTPAHWACLGGHTMILRFMIENKAPVDESSLNELGARPIHWACVNGHIAVVDILLQFGVIIDVVDNKGCTPLIVAAQYGKTMLAGYLMGKGARLQIVDRDGDNALHWSAFKGNSELMQLLIYSGFNPRQKDNYGQTPLHLASINGSLTSVKQLCGQDGVDVKGIDKNGKTPLMLASGRKHEDVVTYLKRETDKMASFLRKIDFWSIVFGPPGNSKGALLFLVVTLLCWGYPMYIFKCLPLTYHILQEWHVIFIVANILMWICLYHANTTDPGFLPRNIPEYDMAIKQVAHFHEWKHGQNPLSRLCHTCRTVKSMRSKHCRVCNRCVKEFDHHCPYIYNCVGYKNRVWFYGFTNFLAVNCLVGTYICIKVLQIGGWDWLIVLGFLEIAFFAIVSVVIAFMSTCHAAINLTTNERINKKRYEYLKDGKGNFYNPYNRGFKKNMLEYLHLKQPLSEQEIEYLNIDMV